MEIMSEQAQKRLKEYKTSQADQLEVQGFHQALSLFKEMAVNVPAYKDFLSTHKINPDSISSQSDFAQVPIIDKNNYLKKYPLEDLCWNGKLDKLSVVSSSSGSTGKSFLWPRGKYQELEGQEFFECMFKDFFEVDKRKTLYINCFSMGTWVAGTYVLSCVERLSWQGYPIITICPGIEKQLTLQLFDDLAESFDQIIIGGYPPFIKDILDEGVAKGVDWGKHKIRFLFAAEGFSEQWRSHIHNLVGSSDSYATSINIYGSADATILAHETPLTNAIRQHIGTDVEKFEKLFGQSRLPTLAQYDPRLRYFQTQDDQLIFSARAGIPLLRYAIGDNGGLRGFNDMHQAVSSIGYDWSKDGKLNQNTWKLPFVWVFGRKNLATNLYGVLIFPEYVKHGLENRSVSKYVTGKFIMSTEVDDKNDQYLSITLELAHGVIEDENILNKVTEAIVDALKKQSSEYNRLFRTIESKAVPLVKLLPCGSAEFAIGSKHRWVKKRES